MKLDRWTKCCNWTSSQLSRTLFSPSRLNFSVIFLSISLFLSSNLGDIFTKRRSESLFYKSTFKSYSYTLSRRKQQKGKSQTDKIQSEFTMATIDFLLLNEEKKWHPSLPFLGKLLRNFYLIAFTSSFVSRSAWKLCQQHVLRMCIFLAFVAIYFFLTKVSFVDVIFRLHTHTVKCSFRSSWFPIVLCWWRFEIVFKIPHKNKWISRSWKSTLKSNEYEDFCNFSLV